VFLFEFIDRTRFWKNADRLGPDIPGTHWRLHFKSTMLKLCKKKFYKFSDTAEFRPGAYAICCSKIEIGDRVIIRPGSMLFGDTRTRSSSIIIENDVMIGSGVHVYVSNHRFEKPDTAIIDQGHHEPKPVTFKQGCWIGAKAIILPGVTIGENSVIGAGSVVTKSVPARVVVAGNPAKLLRSIDS